MAKAKVSGECRIVQFPAVKATKTRRARAAREVKFCANARRKARARRAMLARAGSALCATRSIRAQYGVEGVCPPQRKRRGSKRKAA
jgi:hypothetical protein